MSDARYRTAAWRRVRQAVLERDGYGCRVRGARCAGIASTVHHVVPSSQAPHLFLEMTNLVASCGPCKYADDARVAAANGRRRVAQLEEIIIQQDNKIQELLAQLAEYKTEHPDPALRRARPKPAIY